MTVTDRIKRLEELRQNGIDWSEMDRAMYGPLPKDQRLPMWLRRSVAKDLTGRLVVAS